MAMFRALSGNGGGGGSFNDIGTALTNNGFTQTSATDSFTAVAGKTYLFVYFIGSSRTPGIVSGADVLGESTILRSDISEILYIGLIKATSTTVTFSGPCVNYKNWNCQLD